MSKKIKETFLKHDLIVQHNYLIEAQYKLTIQEKRLLYWLASQSQINDEDFKEHELTIKEFAKLVDVRGDHLYKELAIRSKRLMGNVITIKSLKDRGWTMAPLLAGAKYDDKKGILKVSFSPYLKPYMLQLKERFTKISLGDVLKLKSIYSVRVYELLKQYESIGEREITLEDLRNYCGIEAQKQRKFNHFKQDVLERSKKEINTKTDIFVDYKEVKTARKVTSIIFTINSNTNYKQTEFEKSQQEKTAVLQKELHSELALVERIMEYGFARQAAKKFLQKRTEEEIANAVKAIDLQVSRGNVKNPKAMLLTAIQEKWHPEKYQNKSLT